MTIKHKQPTVFCRLQRIYPIFTVTIHLRLTLHLTVQNGAGYVDVAGSVVHTRIKCYHVVLLACT